MVHCREGNTVGKQHNCTTLPAKSFTVALFLMNSVQKDYSLPKIEGLYFAIKFYYKLLGYTDPCSPFVLSTFLEAVRKLSVHPS